MTATTNAIVTKIQTGAGEVKLEDIAQFLYREARFLDDRDFDRWIDCYHPEATFWMPAWADDDKLTEDPQREISLIFYGNRGGLEDRVFRIKTDRSSATSLPEPRTGHNISNVEIVSVDGDKVDVRFNWFTLYYRYQNVDTYFGTSFYTIDYSGTQPVIMAKKVVLKNDYIHHVVDIYHI
ncbi:MULTISPECIES: benzoate 1,2-dioxygenase small subunit [Paeniglutamicibacter]|uniref:Benzoate/toluate 1,2-dioxygenase beta subunit n=1 Tax=Paeniglutamicibacter sulfureus TaxID=43666 RepID=A0ABU2BKK1_9MICC|nr:MULTISPECIES: benzoate 1,2-dioxygenase small subunit [Paeniglutamicibacter]MCV9994196.1 benzoate 1,2-dioxygenase small subunit [Paeniglutamicibacter sp. ZC-3]MDO2934877.1 benzoate 1,2-dioxygenase small subunit [Paeniglutamicibacter sulfureus]MDR7359168.1 benzoate/toluate 1,2-dioxygenase beta subunit [Paeniglutamicibacter sulfureus]